MNVQESIPARLLYSSEVVEILFNEDLTMMHICAQ